MKIHKFVKDTMAMQKNEHDAIKSREKQKRQYDQPRTEEKVTDQPAELPEVETSKAKRAKKGKEKL